MSDISVGTVMDISALLTLDNEQWAAHNRIVESLAGIVIGLHNDVGQRDQEIALLKRQLQEKESKVSTLEDQLCKLQSRLDLAEHDLDLAQQQLFEEKRKVGSLQEQMKFGGKSQEGFGEARVQQVQVQVQKPDIEKAMSQLSIDLQSQSDRTSQVENVMKQQWSKYANAESYSRNVNLYRNQALDGWGDPFPNEGSNWRAVYVENIPENMRTKGQLQCSVLPLNVEVVEIYGDKKNGRIQFFRHEDAKEGLKLLQAKGFKATPAKHSINTRKNRRIA
jgi:hypothetical protein